MRKNACSRYLVALLGLAGCFAEGEYLVEGDPGATIRVSAAPPPLRYEVPLGCGYGSTFVPGAWDWNGAGWHWRRGRCVRLRSNYVYVRPYYSGGVYYRGHWTPHRGGRYVPPPAPVRPGGYVPPPPPVR